MNPHRILVTGGAGFIGSHSVDLLLRQGKEVVVLDNLFSGKVSNLDLLHPNLEFIEGDILEYPLVEEQVANTDAVLHLAAIASVQESINNPFYALQVNTQGILHILEAVRNAKHDVRLVFASSAAVYGDSEKLPCSDEGPLISAPLSPYALQKKQAEEYANLYARLYNISSLALRYFNVYGPLQDAQSPYSGVISRFLDAYEFHTAARIFGDGTQSRDFIHVKEIASANLLALESDYQGAVNIATGKPKTLLQIIDCIQQVTDKKMQVIFEPERLGDIKSSYGTTELAVQELAFCAQITLQEGIKGLIENIFE